MRTLDSFLTISCVFALLVSTTAAPCAARPRVAESIRASVASDDGGRRLLAGPADWARYTWTGRRDFVGTYMLRIVVDFADPSTKKGQVLLELGSEAFGLERRELPLVDGLPLEVMVEPRSVDMDGQLIATLRPVATGPALRVGEGAVTFERWSKPRKIYPSRRAVEAEILDDGLYRLSADGHRVHYRFDGMDDPAIQRIVGAARIPLPPRGETLRPRRIIVGVGNRLGGMRYEHPFWLPGARERIPLSRADVNLLGTVDVVLGWSAGGPALLLGPQDVWLEVYDRVE